MERQGKKVIEKRNISKEYILVDIVNSKGFRPYLSHLPAADKEVEKPPSGKFIRPAAKEKAYNIIFLPHSQMKRFNQNEEYATLTQYLCYCTWHISTHIGYCTAHDKHIYNP